MLPSVKVLVTMIERLTGRPVRMVDASDFPSLKLEYPAPERPAPLSSRPDWGVTLGVMDRGTFGSGAEATTVKAQATATDENGAARDLALSLSLSTRFVAEQRARVREGLSPLADPLLVSFGGTTGSTASGTSFALDLDPHSGLARLTLAADADASQVATATAAARSIISARNLDPQVNIASVVLMASAAFNSVRAAVAPISTPGLDRDRESDERRDTVNLDVTV